MPRIRITVSERVTYCREVDMTEAEWRALDEATDQRGQAGRDAVEDMTERYIRRTEDWQDADSLRLDDLSEVLDT